MDKNQLQNEPVALFFACDDNYIPCLSVVFESMQTYMNRQRTYDIKILHSGNISDENKKRLQTAYQLDNFLINFVDVSKYIEKICDMLHTRDYYSKSTYFRLFIPQMYPELNKALYLDSDILLLDDVANLYDEDISDFYVGAIPDEAVASVAEFRNYVEHRIGVKTYKEYFNAGILLMNLEKLRNINFEDLFVDVLKEIKFDVAQDQDYLNVICLGGVKFLDLCWNKMPIESSLIMNEDIKLIHYNLSYKPWHHDDVLYSEIFWNFANICEYSNEIKEIRLKCSIEKSLKSQVQSVNLIEMAGKQADNQIENAQIINMIRRLKEKHIG